MSSRPRRRVIAVVADAFSPFHREVVDGLRPHFGNAGFGTLAVTGRDVRDDRVVAKPHGTGGDPSAEFTSRLDVCGAVVVCGATPPDLGADQVADYVRRFAKGPVVSFGIHLPGVASVFIDWDDTIAELMAHLTADSRRRRFVFVRGYAGDPHSVMREAGFRAGLRAAGLPVDESLVVSGHYSVADAMAAVGRLLDHGQTFDAIVAANDDMALGALAALHARGLTVPDDVAVAGFDDSDAAFSAQPPLTSVRLDTPLLAETTANILLEAIHRDQHLPGDLEVHLPSDLIVRASSATPMGASAAASTPEADETEPHAAPLASRVAAQLEVSRAPRQLSVDALVHAAVQTMLTGNDAFENMWAATTLLAPGARRSLAPRDVLWLRHCSTQLRATAISDPAVSDAGLRAMVGQLDRIDGLLLPVEQRHTKERAAHRELLQRMVMRLSLCSEEAGLWSVLRSGLHSLGMEKAWVAANDDGHDDAGAPPAMRLLFSLDDHRAVDFDPFPRSQILPTPLAQQLEEDVFVLVPLRAGSSDIGHLVVEPRGEFLLEFETIASGIAQVLRNLHQIEDLKHKAARLRQANEALDQLSRRDSLTGLANRSAFLDRLQQQMHSARGDEQVTILFLDLDGFKHINDTLGHGAGDHLLQELAERFSALVTDTDMLARLGGDEFTVLLRHPRDSPRVHDVADAVLRAAARPSTFEKSVLQVSASVGIASYPDDGRSGMELLRNADAAMYAAKAGGKNLVVRFSDTGSAPTPSAAL
jgi:diguanylate cyclase (GGDEF)-like protein